MMLTRSLVFLPLLLAAALQTEAEGFPPSKCTPSFVEVSPDETIRTEAGSWRILFKVALVGCVEELETLSEKELETLREEFRDASQWSNFLLVNKDASQEVRRRAVQRVTDILGRRAVTDILFHDVPILDRNVQ